MARPKDVVNPPPIFTPYDLAIEAGARQVLRPVSADALLRAGGFDVITLGADVPVDEVVEACRMHKPIKVTGTAA